MAPIVPRMHLFEIDDQPWFPSFLRAKVQAALTQAWTTKLPFLQWTSPARLVAHLLSTELSDSVHDYVFIDFCAGGGGPTPSIERHLNGRIMSNGGPGPRRGHGTRASRPGSYAAVAARDTPAEDSGDARPGPVRFVLTDLHPHEENWRAAAERSPNIGYEAQSVDAAAVPPELIEGYKSDGKKVFRLFNLAFHHFDDPLASAILKNTVETSDGFGIFELQDRSFSSFITSCIFGVGILLLAPYYAWIWRSPATLIFTYLIPILPFVLVFDGWVSGLRTRTPDEVEALLRSCGADGGPEELSRWEIKSGTERHLWPTGYLNWIVCVRR